MSNTLSSKDFGQKLYNRFPVKYREDDASLNYPLKRYLESLSDGGFKYSIDEINGILSLIDPENADPKVLPILFQQYGLELFNGIPDNYLRGLLPRIGEAWSKKGSLSVVEYITSSLSGIKTSTLVNHDDNGNPTIGVRLEMDYSLGDYFPEAEQLLRLLENFVPFYCDLSLLYSYVFYDDLSLLTDDYEYMDVKYAVEKESGSLISGTKLDVTPMLNIWGKTTNNSFILNSFKPIFDPEYSKDTIFLKHSEEVKLYQAEEFSTLMKLAPICVKGVINGRVDVAEKITGHISDNGTLSFVDSIDQILLTLMAIEEVGSIQSSIINLDTISLSIVSEKGSIPLPEDIEISNIKLKATEKGAVVQEEDLREKYSVKYQTDEKDIVVGNITQSYSMSESNLEQVSMSSVEEDKDTHTIRQDISVRGTISQRCDEEQSYLINDTINEKDKVHSEEKDLSTIELSVVVDDGVLNGNVEIQKSNITQSLLDSGKIKSTDTEQLSSYLDYTEQDCGSIRSTVKSTTNSDFCLMNSFYTNTIYSGHDVIIKDGKSEVIFN